MDSSLADANFIETWEKLLPNDLCDSIIKKIDQVLETSCINIHSGEEQFPLGSISRNDSSFILNDFDGVSSNSVNMFLKECINDYVRKYSQLRECKLMSYFIKAQKTPILGGYHIWHYENTSPETATREIAWMIYLNDIPDGEGETEFFYQRKRIKPTQGTVIMWPSCMTHVHRGLTVYTKEKYILTGWFHKTS